MRQRKYKLFIPDTECSWLYRCQYHPPLIAWLLDRPTSWKSDTHQDVIKWKHFPRYWSFVRGIHRSPVNSPHKGQWRGALMFSLICAWINGWVNNREASDLRRHRAHYDVIVMIPRTDCGLRLSNTLLICRNSVNHLSCYRIFFIPHSKDIGLTSIRHR